MKTFIIIFFLFVSLSSMANNPYRNYLLSKIELRQSKIVNQVDHFNIPATVCVIPRFERPKGAVFCRMEDFLTTKTKVWLKVGVK